MSTVTHKWDCKDGIANGIAQTVYFKGKIWYYTRDCKYRTGMSIASGIAQRWYRKWDWKYDTANGIANMVLQNGIAKIVLQMRLQMALQMGMQRWYCERDR